ncbi:MAG: gamma carbonic anhydrase family protein [Nitrospirota bacterium]|nr:gamma carbonic anhydrase family protein [Nitrospirota bacterium]
MIQSFLDIFPTIPSSVFIAPSADVIGDVVLGEESSVWFGTVIRGDVHYIRIGARTNIQDLSMLHVTRKTHPLVIGNEVTVGHHVTLHGCTLKDRVLVGMGAVILDGAVVGENAMVGAGALVTQGMEIPPGSLVFGNPAKVKRSLKPEELSFLGQSAQNYVDLAGAYLSANLSKREGQ